jgi:(p)ppGpp synthase/HD superfamily hydrolase
MYENLWDRAVDFAIRGHGDQKRKYTGDPYVLHPLEVSRILRHHGLPDAVMIAGLFHDLVEDTTVTLQDISREFFPWVAELVSQVTDVAKPEDGNRAARMQINLDHLAKTDYYGAAIKLADLISNTRNIIEHDKGFAKTYLPEKRKTLEVLTHGPIRLVQEAHIVLEDAEEQLSMYNRLKGGAQ